MKDHEKLLKMIEEVDTEDRDALDEIDARAACFIDGDRKYIGFYLNDITTREFVYEDKNGNQYCDPIYVYRYTQSRDALKAVRPDGWCFDMTVQDDDVYEYTAHRWEDCTELHSSCKTEELTELHAIIQAVAWERENGNER